jgi:aldehyde:ferredoxin oxidoreductase
MTDSSNVPVQSMMKGFFGRIVVINLTDRTYHAETVPREVYAHYLGGKGLGAYLLLTRNPPGVDPFSPDNRVIFVLGPASDVRIWGSSRYGVITKSPLTGLFAESYSGGRLAEHMSRTGYDAIVLEGAASGPLFLEISPEKVLFHDASALWGMDTYAAESAIKQHTDSDKAGVVVIGPAGERLVRFAGIVNNRWRCAGRTGTGAVLGAKKVKGIAFHGDRKRETADPAGIDAYRQQILASGKDMPSAAAFRKFGTPGLVSLINMLEAFPSRYWSAGSFERWREIDAESLHTKCSVRPRACNKCFIACGRMTTILEGPHAGLSIDGPEYETIYAFGGLCQVHDLGEIAFLNDLCDRLGMDTITAGNLAAFAIEAGLRGRTADGPAYGDAAGIAELLGKIARQEDIGGVLAQGIRHAARTWELEDIAIHVKGMEPAGYDPRFFKGMALAYAVSDRGACHMRTQAFRPELAGMIAPDAIEGKAALVIEFEDRITLQDAFILCRFYRDIYPWEEMARIIRLTTGMDVSRNDMQRIASNIRDAVRMFNFREGMTAADESLPRRFFEEPIGAQKVVVKREDFETMKQDYYKLRGWNERGELTALPPLLGH